MFSDPEKNVAYLDLMEGLRVVEFGAGSGAYTLALSKKVGTTGRVYALDVQKELLERLAREMKTRGAHNVKVLWADVDKLGGSKLPDNSADLVLLANILFQSDQKYTMILEAKRLLAPGGLLAVIDWSGSFGHLGPTPERVIGIEEVKQITDQAGLSFVKNFPAGEHHYGLMFQKNKTV